MKNNIEEIENATERPINGSWCGYRMIVQIAPWIQAAFPALWLFSYGSGNSALRKAVNVTLTFVEVPEFGAWL
jgi:hypothetical protein